MTSAPAVPPKLKTAISPVFFVGVILAMTLLGAAAVVFFFNPSTNGFYPICLFHRLTGLNCPGCGATRALYALLHGHLLLAFKDNALFVLVLVAGTARTGWFAWKKWTGRPVGRFLSGWTLLAVLVLALAFGVLRNLPAFAFLSP